MMRAEFPALCAELAEWDGLFHLQIAAFADLMQRAKASADWDTYARGVALADRLWANSDDFVSNAVGVSFLEHLDFNGPQGAQAWKLLTPALQEAWHSIMLYLAALRSPDGAA